jgi:hypothetical protein
LKMEYPQWVERYGNGRRLQLDWRGGCPPVMME